MIKGLIDTLLIIILIGTLPIITLLLQLFIAGLHGIRNHYAKCKDYLPRVAILVPSWNEAEVISQSLVKLVNMDYPLALLRIYVIDDASTDNTRELVGEKIKQHPENIFYIHREKGGQGKSHTLNAGLKIVLDEPWAEAIMIIDADVGFEKNTLKKMTRHLADPAIGAVTCYVKVSQTPGNFMVHCIAAEYILAQAIARRAQNVTRALACLAGGAQLHTRENLLRIGGQINTTTLAEDTYTTFLTQIYHHRAIFEGNCIVRAEEPDNLLAFWKQRFRWARGNIQITKAFKHLWFRPRHSSRLGGIFFGMTWFSTLLMPFFMITTSISLILLLLINPTRSWLLFRLFYLISATSYIFSMLLSFAIDPKTMRRAWFACLVFPGLISVCMMVISFLPISLDKVWADHGLTNTFSWHEALLLMMDAWVSLCMLFAWLTYRLAKTKAPAWLVNLCIIIVGYGPVLCTITFLAFIAETRKSSTVWDKTEKNKLTEKYQPIYHPLPFEEALKKDEKREMALLINEILIILFMVLAFIVFSLTQSYTIRL